MWIVTVLKSEFFWGVIVGLVLSVFGAYWLAVFGARQQQKAQKDQIKNLCIDTVNNLRAIVDQQEAVPPKRGPGRPPGSKNKPKTNQQQPLPGFRTE